MDQHHRTASHGTDRRTLIGLILVAALLYAATGCNASDTLSYTIKAGEVTRPKAVAYAAATLSFEAPKVVSDSKTFTAPADYEKHYESWDPWPSHGRSGRIPMIRLQPRYDEHGTLILGGLYRGVIPNSVAVSSVDGGRTFKVGVDFMYNRDWGIIANKDGRLGTPKTDKVKVAWQTAMQRLDLVQVDSDGKLSVKQGTSRLVCPELPEPDAGKIAVAGVHIAPWQRSDGRWRITDEDVLKINPAAPVKPIGVKHIQGTLKRLKNGQPVSIAFVGDSITLGAEAGPWWDKKIAYTEKDKTYRGRVIYQLRQMYPNAKVEPVEAFQGGKGIEYATTVLQQTVVPAKPNLVIIAMGANDSAGPVGKPAKVSVPKFTAAMTKLVAAARSSGMEVLLLIEMPQAPWLKSGVARRWPDYRKAMLDIASKQGAAVADAHTEWVNLASRGIPPFTQLHNNINHPGVAGHKLFADVVLRCFEVRGN